MERDTGGEDEVKKKLGQNSGDAAPATRVIEAGQIIPADGTVIEGIASVDESAITGESAPVLREAGGERACVTAGTRVVSGRIVVELDDSDPLRAGR